MTRGFAALGAVVCAILAVACTANGVLRPSDRSNSASHSARLSSAQSKPVRHKLDHRLASGPPCAASPGNLALRVAARTGGMSHGVTVYALTNRSHTVCSIRGYPTLVMRGGPRHRLLPTALHRGDVWSCPDPGPHRVILKHGSSAYFAVGTSTGADGPLTRLTSMILTLPGAARADTMPVDNFVTGRPIEVDVTALRSRPWHWM